MSGNENLRIISVVVRFRRCDDRSDGGEFRGEAFERRGGALIVMGDNFDC